MRKAISILIAVETILLGILMVVCNFRLANQKEMLISSLASLNEEQAKLEEETKLENLEEGNNGYFEKVINFYNVEQYLKTPTSKKSEFEEAIKLVQALGYTNAREIVFQIYMEYTFETKYAEYISENGIRKYKASTMRGRLLPANEEYIRKTLYNEHYKTDSADHVYSNEVVIPQQLLTEMLKMDRFLKGMEDSFPLHN